MWHATLGHYNIAHIQRLMSASGVKAKPILCLREPGIQTRSLPLCVSFLREKGRSTSVASTTGITNAEHFDIIKDGHLAPGDIVSLNQYECRVKGRLPNTRGREDPSRTYRGDTLLNNHTSSKIDVYHQVSLGAFD